MYRDYKKPDQPTHIYFLRSGLDHKHFEFLFYVYNRGGLFISKTIQDYFGITQQSASGKIKSLLNKKAIVKLFPREFFSDWTLRNAPQIYRVSNRFLNSVNCPNSSIRKIRDIKKSVRFLNAAHLFLTEPFKDWTLINKASRKGLLSGTYQVPDQAMPRYWVGTTHKEGVVSLNHELATKGDNHLAIIFFQQHTFSIKTEFEKHFLGKWKNLLLALPSSLDLELIAVSDTEMAHHYLKTHSKNMKRVPTYDSNPNKPNQPMTELERFMALSRGEKVSARSSQESKQRSIPPFRHIHYSELSKKYGFDRDAASTGGVTATGTGK